MSLPIELIGGLDDGRIVMAEESWDEIKIPRQSRNIIVAGRDDLIDTPFKPLLDCAVYRVMRGTGKAYLEPTNMEA